MQNHRCDPKKLGMCKCCVDFLYNDGEYGWARDAYTAQDTQFDVFCVCLSVTLSNNGIAIKPFGFRNMLLALD